MYQDINRINPLSSSTYFGCDLYKRVVTIVRQHVRSGCSTCSLWLYCTLSQTFHLWTIVEGINERVNEKEGDPINGKCVHCAMARVCCAANCIATHPATKSNKCVTRSRGIVIHVAMWSCINFVGSQMSSPDARLVWTQSKWKGEWICMIYVHTHVCAHTHTWMHACARHPLVSAGKTCVARIRLQCSSSLMLIVSIVYHSVLLFDTSPVQARYI